MLPDAIATTSQKINGLRQHLTSKYFEVDDFVLCLMLSFISGSHMIVLGQPGIAKSAILREFVSCIHFGDAYATPLFHIQMGADISPNNIFGAPDIAYFKSHGIIKRHTKGFLPDAVIAFCSEFYRVSDQVANSGLLTILNEGEFKNGTDTLKIPLRFFIADTNFFPKQIDDLDAEESDFKLQALHDRFLTRVYLKPLSDHDNKIKMILMDDDVQADVTLSLTELINLQIALKDITLSREIAHQMVVVATQLEKKYGIFISPRRLKMSRNLIKAHALLEGRSHCELKDLMALQFVFWQTESDILKVKDTLLEVLDRPRLDALKYQKILKSILAEKERHLTNMSAFETFDQEALYQQVLGDLLKLMEDIKTHYPRYQDYETLKEVYDHVETTYDQEMSKRLA